MKVLDLRKGEWTALDDKTLEELTVKAELPGNFSMRLLAGEVYRLRACVGALENALEPFAECAKELERYDSDNRSRIKNTWFIRDEDIARAGKVLKL